MLPKIGIDFHLVDKIHQGARTHIIELFSEVIRISPDIQFYLFLDDTQALASHSKSFDAPNVHKIKMPFCNPVKRLAWQLPRLIHRYQLDYFHSQYILPLGIGRRGIVTTHDILFEKYPEYFSLFFRLRSHFLMKASAQKAKHVFAVSEFSKKEIKERYAISDKKISVIYNGVNRVCFFAGTDGAEDIQKHSLISGKYLLSVGRLEPRKNYVTLLRAYAALPVCSLPLVIIGQKDFGYENIYREIRSLRLGHRILFLENISAAELPSFYRHAKLFLYPSWAEGFGMPPIEAMASGVPVIASNTTSIPEVAENAAILANPANTSEWTQAIQILLNDPKTCNDLIAKGFERARTFSWHDAAQRVRAVYLNLGKDLC